MRFGLARVCFFMMGLAGAICTPLQAEPNPSEMSQPQAAVPIAEPNLLPIQENEWAPTSVSNVALPADLWERIRRGFAMPNLENTLVSQREDWYREKPD